MTEPTTVQATVIKPYNGDTSMSSQITLKDVLDVSAVFPDGRICKYLKADEATGMMEGGELYVMGTCRFRGGPAYDRECSGCTMYEAS